MMNHPPLEALYARFDAIAKGRAPGDSTRAHQAVLDRLEANRKSGQAAGWTALKLERQGGSGRLRLWGTPPSGGGRSTVPDSADASDGAPEPRLAATGEHEPDGIVRPATKPLPRTLAGTRLLGADDAREEGRWANERGAP